jgi:hypothetical protein
MHRELPGFPASWLSYQVASTLVAQLEKVRILKETTGRKLDKRYVYSDYLNILAEGTKI